MEGLYKEYFQKSKIFLYPLLGIKKGARFVPVQTYISWGEKYSECRSKLLCLYTLDEDNLKDFIDFSNGVLETSKFYVEKNEIDKYNIVYIFNLKGYGTDYKKFINGKYSKFKKATKEKIIAFFGEYGKSAEYVESYLYPEYYWDDYASFLAIRAEDLQAVGELCSLPDLEKENFEKDLEIIKNELSL